MKLMTRNEDNLEVPPTDFPKKFRWIIGERSEKAKDFSGLAFLFFFHMLFTSLLHDIYTMQDIQYTIIYTL